MPRIVPETCFDNTMSELFDGLIASDGHITKVYETRNSSLSVKVKYEEFANYIFDALCLKPIINVLNEYNKKSNKTYVTHQYRSSRHKIFTYERNRWYPDGIKVLPNDFRFTSTSINMLYLGDGSINKSNRRIILSLQSFEKESLEKHITRPIKPYGNKSLCY